MQTAFLVLALWILLRLQDLPYTFVGVLGSAALASGLNLIPFVGRPLAVLTLVLCLKAVTRSDFVEVRFTVAIAYALLFGVNLFLLGGIGGMSGALPVLARSAPLVEESAASDDEQAPDGAERDPATTGVASLLKALPNTNGPALAASAAAPLPAKPLPHLAIKGVFRNGNHSLVMLESGGKIYTLTQGEAEEVLTPEGKTQVTLEGISGTSVTLNVAGQQVTLPQGGRPVAPKTGQAP